MNSNLKKEMKAIKEVLKPSAIYTINLYILPVIFVFLFILPFMSFLNSFEILMIYIVACLYLLISELVYTYKSDYFKPLEKKDLAYLNKNMSVNSKIAIFGDENISNLIISKYELNKIAEFINKIN